MSNPWYAVTKLFAFRTRARGSDVKFEVDAIEQAFNNLNDALPSLIEAYTSVDLTGFPVIANPNYVLTTNATIDGMDWSSPATVVFNGLPSASGNGLSLLQLNGGETAPQWITPTNAVLAGLPTLVAGKGFIANSGADGLEVAEVGSMVLLDSNSFTAESTAEFEFGTGYDEFYLVVDYYGSGGSTSNLRVDVDNTLVTGSVYNGAAIVGTSSAAVSASSNATLFASSILAHQSVSSQPSRFVAKVFAKGPWPGVLFDMISANLDTYFGQGTFHVQQSGDITSLSIIPASGTITGNYKIYGIK